MSRYQHPDFISPQDEPTNRIRCPIHGFIHYSNNERKVIDHPIFQRLRFVKQLALAYYVYPGATHSRFEHSLGVMEIASNAYDYLISKRADLLESTFKNVEGFPKGYNKKSLIYVRQVVRLGALLHDIGHAPFCHAAESIYFNGGRHENLTAELLTENELGKFIDSIYWPGCAELAAKLILGYPNLPPQFKILNDLIAGEMDADRTDYLQRDSHYCGVQYGLFDFRRMLECLEPYENEQGQLEIAINSAGLHTFEALILARFQMNTQVYFHRIRRIYDYYLKQYHTELGDECPKTTDSILSNNDITMMNKIFIDSNSNAGKKSDLAKRIYSRQHHKVVFDTGFNADYTDTQKARKLFSMYTSQFPNEEFILDPISAKIHQQIKRGDLENKGLSELNVIEHGKRKNYISEESAVINKIERRFLGVRIYTDVEDKKKREELIDFGIKNWKTI